MSNYLTALYQTFPTYQDEDLLVMAGPCAVESRDGIIRKATQLVELQNHRYKIHGLRGGAFKPRTSHKSWQGLGEEGLRYLCEAREITGLPIATEIMDPRHIEMFTRYGIDVWQVGSRNMQNYALLKAIGESRGRTTVLLKRGMASSLKEIEGAIGYLRNTGLILFCLRGLQKMDYGNSEVRRLIDQMPHQNPDHRYFSDVDDIEAVKDLVNGMGHVIVGFDPSHVAGKWQYVPDVARDAIEDGSDFLILEIVEEDEVRCKRECDGEQGVTPAQLAQILDECQSIYNRNVS